MREVKDLKGKYKHFLHIIYISHNFFRKPFAYRIRPFTTVSSIVSITLITRAEAWNPRWY